MSITNIKLAKKIEVFIRLIQDNENLKDACSKAGIKISSQTISLACK